MTGEGHEMAAGREKPDRPSIYAIIPARYDSTRFPGKLLAPLAGKPVIQHTYERARQTPSICKVVVATDDDRIMNAVSKFGGTPAMTGSHSNGTDRIAELVAGYVASGSAPDWVLNVQGDEPLIDPNDLETLIRGLLRTRDGVMGTLVYPLQSEEELHDPNVVKAVLDESGRALYFSRAPVPNPREPHPPGSLPGGKDFLGWRHLGVYLYRVDFLQTFANLPPTPLSEREQLEQLRALEHGYPIHCFQAASMGIGVDVPEDLARAEALLSSQNSD